MLTFLWAAVLGLAVGIHFRRQKDQLREIQKVRMILERLEKWAEIFDARP